MKTHHSSIYFDGLVSIDTPSFFKMLDLVIFFFSTSGIQVTILEQLKLKNVKCIQTFIHNPTYHSSKYLNGLFSIDYVITPMLVKLKQSLHDNIGKSRHRSSCYKRCRLEGVELFFCSGVSKKTSGTVQ